MTVIKQGSLLLMMLLGFSSLLSAQASATVRAHVPFAFVANGKTIPSGECIIAVFVNGRTLLSIGSGRHHAYAVPIPDESPSARKRGALVFHRYGDRYFLNAMERENGSGYRLPVSKLERELHARNIPWQVFTLLASAD